MVTALKSQTKKSNTKPQLIEVIERHKDEDKGNYDYLVQTSDSCARQRHRKGTRYHIVTFGEYGCQCFCEDRIFNSGVRSLCKHENAVLEVLQNPRIKFFAIADITYNPNLTHGNRQVKWQATLIPNGKVLISSSCEQVKFLKSFCPTLEIPVQIQLN